jgi:hypothetical protein
MIYELCRKVKPQATLEIGLTYGFSTIYFLAVLAENGNGRHSSIDPYQRCHPGRCAGIGLRPSAVARWRGRGLAAQRVHSPFMPHYSLRRISLDGSKPTDSYKGRPCSLAGK